MSLNVKVTVYIKLINPSHPGVWTDVARLYLWNNDISIKEMQRG
jgi:hypothetical protein